jgi:hypothetical protein
MNRFIPALVALVLPGIAQAQVSLPYFSNPSLKATSDASFDAAMSAIQSAPSLSKGSPWKDILEYQKTGKPQQAQTDIRSAALIGNPRALLVMCISRSDRQGPPAFLTEGFAWCRIAGTVLPDAASQLRERAKSVAAQSERSFSPEQIEQGKAIERQIRLEMKTGGR